MHIRKVKIWDNNILNAKLTLMNNKVFTVSDKVIQFKIQKRKKYLYNIPLEILQNQKLLIKITNFQLQEVIKNTNLVIVVKK